MSFEKLTFTGLNFKTGFFGIFQILCLNDVGESSYVPEYTNMSSKYVKTNLLKPVTTVYIRY